MTRLRCQRIGCKATFTEDVNPEGSCTYHDSGPLFHDGMKEWSCCKKRSHDFSLFLEIPGCKTGRHTTEKPVLAKPAPKIATVTPLRPSSLATNISVSEACSRCKQGLFCSDHGSVARNMKQESANTAQVASTGLPKKIIGINEPQVCKNQGCGHTFKEKDNHDTACNYHPGQAVFHDRIRGWKCCGIYVQEFDEFMSIPPCTKGWHNADPTP